MKERNFEVIVCAIIENASGELNDWETGFIDDIFNKGNYETLTENQKAKILDIHTLYCKCG